MRNAPSVSYPVGRCSLAGGLIAAVGALGAAVIAAGATNGLAGWRLVAAGALLAACVAWASLALWRSCAGRLAWSADGTWRWQDARQAALDDEAGTALLSADLQRWILLRWRPAHGGRCRWLWLEARRDPAQWRALRRAVYSPAGVDAAAALAPDRPPASKP